MTKIYCDWAIEKPWWIAIEDEEPQKISFDNFIKLLNKDTEVFCETGLPRDSFQRPILEAGAKLRIVSANKIKEKRRETVLTKTDENDTVLIRIFINDGGHILLKNDSIEDLENVYWKGLLKRYEHINKDATKLKNLSQSFGLEYGRGIERDAIIDIYHKEKIKILKKFGKRFKPEIELFKNINGVSTYSISAAMINSDPNKFRSVSAFLRYVGFSEKTKFTQSGKRRHNKKRIPFYFMVNGVIKKKNGDLKYRKLYEKIKIDLRIKFPDDPPYVIENRTKNRLSTILAKDFYQRIRNQAQIRLI